MEDATVGPLSSSPCTVVARFPQRSRLAIDSIERFECLRCSPSHKKALPGFIPGLFNFGVGYWPQARSKAGESNGSERVWLQGLETQSYVLQCAVLYARMQDTNSGVEVLLALLLKSKA